MISVWVDLLAAGVVQTFNIAIVLDTINVINVKLCMNVIHNELFTCSHPFQ